MFRASDGRRGRSSGLVSSGEMRVQEESSPEAWQASTGSLDSGLLLLAFLVAVDAGLVALHVASGAFAGRVVHLVDLDGEGNIPSWWSSAKLLLATFLMAMAALRNLRTDRRAWALALLCGVLLAMSLDESASLHERAGTYLDLFLDRRGSIFPDTGYWPLLVGLPAVAAISYVVWLCGSFLAEARDCLGRFIVSLMLLLGAAVGLELLNNIDYASGRASEVLEEGVELLGGSLLVWAALGLVQRHPSTAGIFRALGSPGRELSREAEFDRRPRV